ncbi:integrase [Mycolicibacterium baixiangningiae]|uniref:integrase n=1 Tax=Mycolicibacterium baixiangningiae TaxID=2761578 RepID=UPI001865BBA7|nr:integrase [Mycolicibacterium baixiangningiae]
MSDGRTSLIEGTKVLTQRGFALTGVVGAAGVTLHYSCGETSVVSWVALGVIRGLEGGEVCALSDSLRPLWDTLVDDVREAALFKMEIVQEILTGYRDGHQCLARPGEPRPPYGPSGASENQRCKAMAAELNAGAQLDRRVRGRLQDGETRPAQYSPSTLRLWVRNFKERGLLALIDERSTRQSKSWELIDSRYRQVATQIVDTLDGDRSTISNQEIDRRTRVQLKENGIDDFVAPERITREYLAHLKRERGTTTRAQRSRKSRRVSGAKHYPAIRPGQVVAIDVTRADNLVYDPLSGDPCSVEIITAIDVATRVVLALRVVPRSAKGFEAGLLLYDICRPFSLQVDGTSIGDWRWVGLPEQLDLSGVPIQVGKRVLSPNFTTLQGEHGIPSVMPDAIRCDHGSIFVCMQFRALLIMLGIDLMLNRGGKPNDNPHVERWHETIQRGLQQIPGYKGRNVSQRGKLVAEEPLLTARQLQDHLCRFIALDYHRYGHEGIILPGEEAARVCPLELWDAMTEITGRIDVPQQPDLIYQFLPVKWGTISHAGVEFKNMVYDSLTVLEPYRSVPVGQFRAGDRAAPFFYDPQDLSRIWFHDPATKRVEPIEWRGSDRTVAPMTEAIVNLALKRIRRRGGNLVLNKHSATRQIIDELGQITETPAKPKLQKQLIAARMREERAKIDHAEAQRVQDHLRPARPPARRRSAAAREVWPPLPEGI